MKKLLTIVAIATLSLGLGAISLAQDAGPQGGQLQSKKAANKGHAAGGFKLVEKIQKDILSGLSLTKDQQDKISDLNKTTEADMRAINKANKGAKGSMSDDDKKALASKRRDEMKKYNESLRGILTPDQFKSYHQQMMAKMKELRDKRKADKGDGGKP